MHMLYSGLGGHGSVFFSLVEADIKKEFDYRAVFCGTVNMLDDYKINCRRLQVPYHYLTKKNGVHTPSFFHLFKFFFKNRPTVIFLHGVTFGIISAFCYKIIKPRTKIIVRDTQAHHLKTRMEWFWMFFCILLAKRIVVLTEVSAEGLKKKFGWMVQKKKIVLIPNGLKIEKYKPVGRLSTEKKIAIGMQSRLQPIKDHPTLLRAFAILKEKFTNYSLSLHIAGDGETMPTIQELIKELGLQESVRLHGMLNESELIEFMHSLDIYVHATFGETLSNSIMQAMACGLPVIASDVWGVNNMITNNQTGLLYKSGDFEQLATLLEKLFNSPELRTTLGNAARDFAINQYSDAVMFSRYKQLFSC